MENKYPLTGIGGVSSDTRKWYEAEQCWNCEPEELQKILIRKSRSSKARLTKRL